MRSYWPKLACLPYTLGTLAVISCMSASTQTPRGRGSIQNQTSANQTAVRKALRLALSSPSKVIAMLKELKN